MKRYIVFATVLSLGFGATALEQQGKTIMKALPEGALR